jgi:hypothetical protein
MSSIFELISGNKESNGRNVSSNRFVHNVGNLGRVKNNL